MPRPPFIQIAALLLSLLTSGSLLAADAPVFQRFFEGSSAIEVNDVVIAGNGDIYLAGSTTAAINGSPAVVHGDQDAFVARLDSSGALITAVIFGGNPLAADADSGLGLALGPQGDVYVTGQMRGPVAGLGAVVSADCQATLSDAFVLRLDDRLTPLRLRCFGGDSLLADRGTAVGVAADGTVYVAGETKLRPGEAFFGQLSSNQVAGGDAFVIKYDGALSSLPLFAYLLPGSSEDAALALAVDASGQAFITGSSNSTDLPVSSDALQAQPGGDRDAFIVQLNGGGALVYSSYLGGGVSSGRPDDQGNAIAVSASGDLYVLGESMASDLATGYAGAGDAFLLKLRSDHSQVYRHYLGSAGFDRGLGLVLDNDQPVVVGLTNTAGLPQSPATDTNYAWHGGVDAFLTRFDSLGNVVESRYLGGSDDETDVDIAVRPQGGWLIAGTTSSTVLGSTSRLPATGTAGYLLSLAPVTTAGGGGQPTVVANPVTGGGSSGGGAIQLILLVLTAFFGRRYSNFVAILVKWRSFGLCRRRASWRVCSDPWQRT